MNECPECNAMLQVDLASEDEHQYYVMVHCNHCGYRMPMVVDKQLEKDNRPEPHIRIIDGGGRFIGALPWRR